ncbi:copper chaperone PCu(A)C [Methylobacterium sp. WL19]|uniref:copper chaperone PCu(A)C n=1 Tax=Methylobacterium sp. WL19 TaxID=2603896 RepID=UPI0011CB1764|nr:copper chaperone PCu(A)C [Methylobacterium sp. WL19]TXN27494.1 copper chaperone PCu(A)C [Methylobacterium sp. WL19]
MKTNANCIRHLCTLVALLAAAGGAYAHEYSAGSLKIGHPWSRATPGGAKVAGGYVSVTNTGSEPDRLIGGAFDQAAEVEVHSMTMENGVMKMAPVEGGLVIKPAATVTLGPGGYHLMFMGLKAPLKQGEMIKGTLTFEKAGVVPVEFLIEGIAAKGTSADHGGHDHAR